MRLERQINKTSRNGTGLEKLSFEPATRKRRCTPFPVLKSGAIQSVMSFIPRPGPPVTSMGLLRDCHARGAVVEVERLALVSQGLPTMLTATTWAPLSIAADEINSKAGPRIPQPHCPGEWSRKAGHRTLPRRPTRWLGVGNETPESWRRRRQHPRARQPWAASPMPTPPPGMLKLISEQQRCKMAEYNIIH